ncbi:hypothetical protein D3Y57_02515 (plasmid) [Sphingomonas paeninsulae]|uniref:Lipoprotein n=2 Tax=Sphingomonas paeninsulae TaxID=2319844 RepID=A0A494TGK9_SPHPE|nr:hypothetical protein D3Y57_02515 [Sphingomonas paeninsulae]
MRAICPKPITSMMLLMTSTLAMAGCHVQPLAERWNSSRISAYEPFKADISGFPSTSDKAKLVPIAAYMRERLIYHHVDAPHANAILWQFHFFAPVKFLEDDCTTYIDLLHQQTYKNEDKQIGKMADSAKDVFDRYDQSIPYSQLASGAYDNTHKTINSNTRQVLPMFEDFRNTIPLNVSFEFPLHFNSKDEERYFEESRIIGDEIRNNIYRRFPESMMSYHIRNFIMNVYNVGINVDGRNAGIATSGRLQAAKYARGYFGYIEYLYQTNSGKSSCKT